MSESIYNVSLEVRIANDIKYYKLEEFHTKYDIHLHTIFFQEVVVHYIT